MLRRLSIVLLMLGLGFPTLGWALGLGKLETYSHLNQPVKAQAKLVGLGNMSLSSVSASLASPQLFQQVGIPFSEEAIKLQFKVLRASDGSPYIEISSLKPMSDPNIPFLLQLTWPGGNLLRQYTLLLNPEEHTLPKKTQKAKIPVSKMPVAGSAVTKAGKKYYGPTTQNDRLWAIATHHRPDPIVSTPQTAIAIFLMNPDAFRNSSPSELKQKATLVLPSLAVVKRIPDQIARRLLSQKAIEVSALQQRYGISKVELPENTATSKTPLKPEKKAEQAKKQPQKAKPSSANTQMTQLTQQVLHLAEQKNQQLEVQLLALQTKYKALEKQEQAKTKQITALQTKLQSGNASTNAMSKSDDTLNLQKNNRQLEAKLLALERRYDMLKLASQEQVKRIATLQEKNRSLLNQGRRVKVTEINQPIREKAIKKTGAQKSVPLKKVPDVKAQKEDSILSIFWFVAIAIVIIAIFYWLWTKWRSLPRDETVSSSNDIEHEPDASMAASIVFTKNDSGKSDLPSINEHQTPEQAEPDLVQDKEPIESVQSQVPEEMTLDDTLVSDPIEEADVYLAYDRFEQAESVLLNALTQKPEHHSWRIKLLAVYSKMQKLDQFNQILTQIPQTFLDQHPHFSEQVCVLMKTFETESNDQASSKEKTNLAQENESELDESFFPEDETLSETGNQNNTIPFTPGLGISLTQSENSDDTVESLSNEPLDKSKIDIETLTTTKTDPVSSSENEEPVTVAEVLAYAEQLIAKGDTSTAEKLLTKAYYQGTPEERDKARQLLDNL